MTRLFFVLFFTIVHANFQVLEPQSLEGIYATAPLRLNPILFNLTGELILSNPTNACSSLKNNVTGKIVVSIISSSCSPSQKAHNIKNAGGLALVIFNYGLDNAHSGFYYYAFPNPGDTALPAIMVSYVDNLIAALKKGQEGIIVSMSSSTENPWADEGQSGIGIAMQVTLELIAFACFVCSSYKLYFFISKNGIQASISQLCLSFELIASIIRIIYFIQPLQYRNDIAGDKWNQYVEPTFVELAMPITYMTTLLVTFYWQDVFRKINDQVSIQFMKNLGKSGIEPLCSQL